MSLLSRLFGSGPAEPEQPEDYKGYRVFPDPISEGGKWRIAARIEKDVDGETKEHQLIRADLLENQDEARTQSAAKCRQVIDEQGDRLFD